MDHLGLPFPGPGLSLTFPPPRLRRRALPLIQHRHQLPRSIETQLRWGKNSQGKTPPLALPSRTRASGTPL